MTTKEIYMSNCIPKLTKNVKSLYFVTIDEIIIPRPKPNIPMHNINTGNKNKYSLGLIAEPAYKA